LPIFKNHKQIRMGVLALLALTFSQSMTNLSHADKTVTYFHTDALGSVVAASDESGDLLWRKSYSPFGEKVSDGEGEPNAISYTGKKHDDVTGLTYFGARYYDPEVGRFMGMDPAGFSESTPLSFNRFAYGNNNPYRYIDPDGLSPVDPHDGDEGSASVHSSSRMQSALRGDSAHLTPMEGLAEGVTNTVMMADTISDDGNPIKGAVKHGIKKAVTKLSKVNKEVREETIGNGKFTKKTKVFPGKGPGQSRSEMEFVKNSEGKLIRSRKFSFDRGNKFQHKKSARGGPEGRKADED